MRGGSIFLALLLGCVSAPAGSFELSVSNGLYSLVANDANVAEILAEIDRQVPAPMGISGDHDRLVSLKLKGVGLHRLLDGLGVGYVLTYEPDAGGEYRLSDATTMELGENGVDAVVAARIRKLIRDLRADDIPGNAMRAQDALREFDCAAVPFLEETLHDPDFQARQAAASVFHMLCPEHPASDRMIEVCFELLNAGEIGYSESYLMNDWDAFYLLADSNVYPRVRSRILNNLQSADPRERFYSALIAAQNGESAHASTLVRIMAPHLADNDLINDAGAAAHALYSLGRVVLPHLMPYMDSPDTQQAELTTLIVEAFDNGPPADFNGVMYASFTKVPLAERPMFNVLAWPRDLFPDEAGRYHNLRQPRSTSADLYGTTPEKK